MPVLYYVIGATLIIGAILRIPEWGDPGATIMTVLGFAVGALAIGAATAAIVRRHRTGESLDEPSSLAQENDPRTRQQR